MVEAHAPRIVVAETGNKRQNISDEDLVQCIKDVVAWLQENAPAHYTAKIEGAANTATADQVTALLSEFDAGACSHLAISLQKFNGGIQYEDSFVGLSVDEINAVGTEKGLKARKIVPFARDADEQLLCV